MTLKEIQDAVDAFLEEAPRKDAKKLLAHMMDGMDWGDVDEVATEYLGVTE